MLGGLRDFIEPHHIVTIPSPVPPIVEETPPFMRALTTASMDTPGPYEKVAKEAFFNVTLPEPTWPPKADRGVSCKASTAAPSSAPPCTKSIPATTCSSCGCKHAPTKVRKLMGCSSNAEGWAHYSEQMMLDEGYGNGDLKLRLGQLQDALLRDARYIAGIRMHTGKMTMEQAIEFFVKEGYQVRPVAEKEAKRGTSDPTYLVYTLGKLEILKLREDYKKMKGAQYSLAGLPRRLPGAGLSAHQDRPPRPAGQRFAGAVIHRVASARRRRRQRAKTGRAAENQDEQPHGIPQPAIAGAGGSQHPDAHPSRRRPAVDSPHHPLIAVSNQFG